MPFRTFAEQASAGGIAFAGTGYVRRQYGAFIVQTQFDAVGTQAADLDGKAVFAIEFRINPAVSAGTSVITVIAIVPIVSVTVTRAVVVMVVIACAVFTRIIVVIRIVGYHAGT